MANYSYWNEYVGFRFSLSAEALLKLPRWAARDAFPPLSPRAAIANAETVVKGLLKEAGSFDPKFSRCSLRQLDEEAWYYEVCWFVPDHEDAAADWSEFSVPVLFDGSTPKPHRFNYVDRFEIYGWPD